MPNLPALGMGRFLPCSILSRRPYVLAAYERDFLNHVDAYARALPGEEPVTLFIQLGWQCRKAAAAAKLAQEFRAVRERLPQISRVLILANEPEEVAALSAQGMEVVLCHQNAFLDERRYPILPFLGKRYDAIYIARITPFKRHVLLSEVESLYLIGDYSEKEHDYAEATLRGLPRARWSRKYTSRLIMLPINRARCGMCLSAEEGAMFVSAEYLLCGLPVVNTANIGGRDLVMPDFAVAQVADEPAVVAAAVRQWAAQAPPATDIRAATLAMMRPHREKLLALLRDAGVSDDVCARYARRIPHKLGLRCGQSPWRNMTMGLPWPAGTAAAR